MTLYLNVLGRHFSIPLKYRLRRMSLEVASGRIKARAARHELKVQNFYLLLLSMRYWKKAITSGGLAKKYGTFFKAQ